LEPYASALFLIEKIDLPKGSIGVDYSKPLLTLFAKRFNKGSLHGLGTALTLFQYSITESSQQKQLCMSILSSAKYWLDQNRGKNASNSLDMINQLLDGIYHSGISQQLGEVQSLMSELGCTPIGQRHDDLQTLNALNRLENQYQR